MNSIESFIFGALFGFVFLKPLAWAIGLLVYRLRKRTLDPKEISELADDLFVQEYNKWREEAIRRAK